METETVSQPKTSAGYEKTVECDNNYCEMEVLEEATVTVECGSVQEQWCYDCAVGQFGEKAYNADLKDVLITPERVLLVFSWILIIALLVVIP